MGTVSLPDSAAAWGSTEFNETLKRELGRTEAASLPLQQALARSSYVSQSPHTAVVLGATEQGGTIHAKVGIFYTGIIAGCSCADDPTPMDEENEYCELLLEIDKSGGETVVHLLDTAA